jgi:hypothetical protein
MGKTKAILDLLGKPIGALGDLMKSETKKETVDPTRRKIIAGTVAAPIAAGALSGIPQKVVQKIADSPAVIPEAPVVAPIAKKAVTKAIVKNIGQPTKHSVINGLMDFTDFGHTFNYGSADMKAEMGAFISELNKAKKYFTIKKNLVDEEELGMISPSNGMGKYLEELQEDFGYTDDEILNLINETSSITKKNEGVWEDYFKGMSEGDPEFGKKYNLGTKEGGWGDYSEDDLWKRIYGSDTEDITGNTIMDK